MVVEGQAIRFCQQCGRFQLLDEFDGDRRSCKKKLEKHNERRRKAELTASEQEKDAPYVPRSYRYRYPEDRDPKSSKQHKNSSPTHLSDVNGEYLDQQQQGYYMPAPEYDASFLAALADVAVSAQHQDDPDAGQASFSSLPSFSLPAPQLLHPSSQPHAPFPLQITSHPLPIDAHPTSTSHTSIENADADASISPAILNMLTSAINSTAEGTAKTAATEVPLAEVKADLLDALKKDADAAPPGSRRLLPHMNGSFTQSSRSAFSRLRIDSSDGDRSTIGDPFASNPSSFNSRGYYYSRNSSMNSNNAAVEAAAAAAAAAAAFQNSVPAAASAEVMRVLEGALGIDQGEMAHWMGMLHSVRGEQQQPVNEHHMAPLQQQPGHPVSEAVMTEAAGTDAVPAMAMECAKQSLQPEPIPASMDNEVVNMCVKVFKATPDQLPAGLISELKSWMSKTPSYGEGMLYDRFSYSVLPIHYYSTWYPIRIYQCIFLFCYQQTIELPSAHTYTCVHLQCSHRSTWMRSSIGRIYREWIRSRESTSFILCNHQETSGCMRDFASSKQKPGVCSILCCSCCGWCGACHVDRGRCSTESRRGQRGHLPGRYSSHAPRPVAGSRDVPTGSQFCVPLRCGAELRGCLYRVW